MRPGGPAGLSHLCDGLPRLYLLPLPHKDLAAMGIECHIPAAVVDGKMLPIPGAAGIPHKQHRPALHSADLRACTGGNIQAGMVACPCADAGIRPFAEIGGNIPGPVCAGEGIPKAPTLQRGVIALYHVLDLTVGSVGGRLIPIVHHPNLVLIEKTGPLGLEGIQPQLPHQGVLSNVVNIYVDPIAGIALLLVVIFVVGFHQ